MTASLALTAVYLILLGIALQGRTRRNPAEGWLLVFCGYSTMLMGLHALISAGVVTLPTSLAEQLLALLGFVISVGMVAMLTLAYLALNRQIMWGVAILIVVWGVALLIVELSGAAPLLGSQPWVVDALGSQQVTIGFEVAALGWMLISLLLFVLTWRAFLSEPLPLYANRILFWAAVSPTLLFGDALTAWSRAPWHYVGYGLRLAGAIGAVYAVVSHRVIDLREFVRWFVSRLILMAVTGALVFGGIAVVLYVSLPGLGSNNRWILGIVVAALVALLLPPIMQFFRWLLRGLISRGLTDATEVIRLYSQRISGVIELKDLADAIAKNINELLATRRAQMILATHVEDHIVLEQVGGQSEAASSAVLSTESPIYRYFMTDRQPLLQYDIDYHKDYIAVLPQERRYFAALEMDIYAPIVKEDRLIGLLAVGPKVNDDPFRPNEIELLEALANQTVGALENARLVNDLRMLNQRISALNEDLRTTNERLQLLDSVKTDFISIASHELRTPLTQIQGYADLLIEMAERNLLTPEELSSITSSLSKASQRMADVITSMLDVSQIDVDSMDLNFVETTLSNILKLAIEPYANPIHDRKQTLVARGLRNLPPITGDYKRLVQAFQNLITNAIKFTPDGGRIDVIGEVFERDEQGQPISLRVMIKDTGIGIDKEHHSLIFEKFYRVGSVALHSTGTTKFKGGGPGLGLAIARGIIEAHGGRIWVESEGHDEEKLPGSTFHVVLPLRPPALDAQKRIQEISEAKQETIVHPSLLRPKSSEEDDTMEIS